MFLLFAIVAVFFIFSAIMPKKQIEDARVGNLGDFQFPRSQYGDVVPIIFGTVEQKSPIVTWFGAFAASPITQDVSTGLFSSDTVITGYQYTIAMDLAICLGPDVFLRQIKSENKLIWGGGVASAGQENITVHQENLYGGPSSGGGLSGTIEFYEGRYTQPKSPYMSAIGVAPLSRYNGVCHAVFCGFYVGTQPNVAPFSFVVQRVTNYLSASYSKMGADVNPMEIAWITLTQKWGHLGIPENLIDKANFQAAAQVLHGEGLGMSMLVSAETTGKSVLEECMRVADGLMYQEPITGLIKVALIRSNYIVGDLPVLDESNIIGDLENLGKTTWESTYNQVRVTFKNRDMEYNEGVALLQDFANIMHQERIKSTTISMPGVKTPAVASKMAQRQLSMVSVPLFKCDIKANRSARGLRPGSCFVLNWSEYGLTNLVMRVTSIDLGDLLNGEIKLTCVQDRFAVDLPTFADPGESGHIPITTEAQEITNHLVWEPPSFFLGNGASMSQGELNGFNYNAQFMALAKAPGSASVSFNVYLGQTDEPTSLSLADTPYYGRGVLVSNYSAGVAGLTGVDASNTFDVSGIDQKTLEALTQNTNIEDAREGDSMFMINNELFAYVGFTDMGAGVVRFNVVYRSLLDTVRASHDAGDTVWFIRRGSGLLPQGIAIGDDVWFKLTDRTPKGPFPLEDADSFSKTLAGRASKPLPPQYVLLEGSRSPAPAVSASAILVSWSRRSRLNPRFRVYDDPSDVTFEPIGNLAHRVRWSLDGGSETTVMVYDSGSYVNSLDLDVDGLAGVLTVRVDTLDTLTGFYSTEADSCQIELT